MARQAGLACHPAETGLRTPGLPPASGEKPIPADPVTPLAYGVHVTLRGKLRRHAPGLTTRQAIDHLGRLQMIDVRLPTTDGRELLLRCRTEPDAEQQLLPSRLPLVLPEQPPPKISTM